MSTLMFGGMNWVTSPSFLSTGERPHESIFIEGADVSGGTVRPLLPDDPWVIGSRVPETVWDYFGRLHIRKDNGTITPARDISYAMWRSRSEPSKVRFVMSRRGSYNGGSLYTTPYAFDFINNHPNFFSLWCTGDIYDNCTYTAGLDTHYILKSDVDKYLYLVRERSSEGERVPNCDQRIAVGQERPELSAEPSATQVSSVLFFKTYTSNNRIIAEKGFEGFHKIILVAGSDEEADKLYERIGRDIVNNCYVAFTGWPISLMDRTYLVRFMSVQMNVTSGHLWKLTLVVEDDGGYFENEVLGATDGLPVSMFIPKNSETERLYGLSFVRDFGRAADESGLTFTKEIQVPKDIGSLHTAHAPWCFRASFNDSTVDADYGSDDSYLIGKANNGAEATRLAFPIGAYSKYSGSYLRLPGNAYVEYDNPVNAYVADRLLVNFRQLLAESFSGTKTGDIFTVADSSNAARVSLGFQIISSGGSSYEYTNRLFLFNDYGEVCAKVSVSAIIGSVTPSLTEPLVVDYYADIDLSTATPKHSIAAALNGTPMVATVNIVNDVFWNRNPVNHKLIIGCDPKNGKSCLQYIDYFQLGNFLGVATRVKIPCPNEPKENTNRFSSFVFNDGYETTVDTTLDGHTSHYGVYALSSGEFRLLDYSPAIKLYYFGYYSNVVSIAENCWGVDSEDSARFIYRSVCGAEENGIKYGTCISIPGSKPALFNGARLRYIGEEKHTYQPYELGFSDKAVIRNKAYTFRYHPIEVSDIESAFFYSMETSIAIVISIFTSNSKAWEFCARDYGEYVYDSGNRVLLGQAETYYQASETGDIINFSPPPKFDMFCDSPFRNIFFGSVGSRIYWSVQNNVHAWPENFYYDFNSRINGIVSGGAELFVLTESAVYVSRPTSSYFIEFNRVASEGCVSKYGFVPHRDGVIYIALDGLRFVGGGGALEAVGEDVIPRGWFRYVEQSGVDVEGSDLGKLDSVSLGVKGDVLYIMSRFGCGIRYDTASKTASVISSVPGAMYSSAYGILGRSSSTATPLKYLRFSGGILILLSAERFGFKTDTRALLKLSVVEDYQLVMGMSSFYDPANSRPYRIFTPAMNIITGRIEGVPPDFKHYSWFRAACGAGTKNAFASLVSSTGVVCGGSKHINEKWDTSHLLHLPGTAGVNGDSSIPVPQGSCIIPAKGVVRFGSEVSVTRVDGVGGYVSVRYYSKFSEQWIRTIPTPGHLSYGAYCIARYCGRYKYSNDSSSDQNRVSAIYSPPECAQQYSLWDFEPVFRELNSPYPGNDNGVEWVFSESWCGPIFDVVDEMGNLTTFKPEARVFVPCLTGINKNSPWCGPYSGCIFHGLFASGEPYWLQIFDDKLAFMNDTGVSQYFTLEDIWPDKMNKVTTYEPWVLPVPYNTDYARWVFPEPGVPLDMSNEDLATIAAPFNEKYEYLHYCLSVRQELELLPTAKDYRPNPHNKQLGEIRGVLIG